MFNRKSASTVETPLEPSGLEADDLAAFALAMRVSEMYTATSAVARNEGRTVSTHEVDTLVHAALRGREHLRSRVVELLSGRP